MERTLSYEAVDWIQQAQNKVQCWSLINMVINVHVS